MKLRGFEKITSFKEVDFPMPERKTKMAAGYDICLPQDVTIKAHTLQMVPDRRKSYMQDDEFFGRTYPQQYGGKKKGWRW